MGNEVKLFFGRVILFQIEQQILQYKLTCHFLRHECMFLLSSLCFSAALQMILSKGPLDLLPVALFGPI